jgi:hypothetical protein
MLFFAVCRNALNQIEIPRQKCRWQAADETQASLRSPDLSAPPILLDRTDKAFVVSTSTMKGKLKMKKQDNTFKAILLVLGCLAFLPQMQAVSPVPDGCYPGFTTAEGCNALSHLTSGSGNTGLGWYALFGTSTGSFNTGVGAGALTLNNEDSNTAVGTAALLLNTAGTGNSALGTAALVNNDNGSNNTAVGDMALQNNTSDFNTALGAGAGAAPGILSNNIYIGDAGLDGDNNIIAIGNIPASGTPYDAMYVGGVVGAGIPTANAVPVYIDQTTGQLGTVLTDGIGKKATGRIGRGTQHQSMLDQFQKQQNRITELESMVARLAATVKDQAAQIEKVSAQLELRKPARRVVVNKQ